MDGQLGRRRIRSLHLSLGGIALAAIALSGCGGGSKSYASLSSRPPASTTVEETSPVPEPAGGQQRPTLLGYRPASTSIVPTEISGTDPSGLAVIPSAVNQVDGVLYGLVINPTSQLATDIEISALGQTYRYPLSVQPGETAPFELPLDTQIDRSAISVTANLTDGIDLGRSLLLYQAPGWWTGPRGDLPAPRGLLPPGNPDETIQYYETVFGLVVPAGREDLRSEIENTRATNLVAFVAYLDSDGSVTGLDHLEAVHIDPTGAAAPIDSIGFGELGTLGFLIPDGSVDFVLWIGTATGGPLSCCASYLIPNPTLWNGSNLSRPQRTRQVGD